MPEHAENNSFLCLVVSSVLGAFFLICLAAGAAHSAPHPGNSPCLSSGDFTPALETKLNNTVQDFGALTPGEVVRRKMGGREAHVFHIALAAGQFLRVIVEQQGVDVEVRILGPQANQQPALADSPNGLYGPESVSVISELAGDYLIEVRSDKSIPDGGYELRADGPREPAESDRERVAAEALFTKGQILSSSGDPESLRQAIAKYAESLALWEKLGDAHGRAYTTCNIGRAYKRLCDIPDAVAHLNSAASILREAQDDSGEAWVLNEIGAIYRNLGDSSQAVEPYRRAIQLRLVAGDIWGQAQVLNNLGLAYANMGRYQQAVESYRQAISLWQATKNSFDETNTLNNLYLSSSELGDVASSLNNFQKLKNSCQAAKDCKDSPLEGFIHNNIGKILDSLAESQDALDEYSLARDIFHNKNRPEDEAMVLDNIGMVYAGLGDAEEAQNRFKDSLQLRQPCSARGRGITNTNIGYAYVLEGKPQKAIEYFDIALPLNREAQNMPFVAYALVAKGMAHASMGMPQVALDLYRQALGIQTELGDIRGQAITLEKIGQVYASTGDGSRALDSYGKSLERWDAVKDRQGRALTLYDIARAEHDSNNLEEARKHVEEAIGIVESLRTNLMGERLRLTYFAAKQDFYELDVDVRMLLFARTGADEHRDAALHASERARARSLLELLAEAHADINKEMPPQVAERAHSLEREIGALTEKLIRARNLDRAESKEVAALESRFEASTRDLGELQAKARAGNQSNAGLKQPEPLRLEQIRHLLDDDTLLLEYSLGERRSYLWAVTRLGVESYELPTRPKVEAAVNDLRTLLTVYESQGQGESSYKYWQRLNASQEQYALKAEKLSQVLLGPVASRLRVRRMVVVGDGALLYLPFEALPLPRQPEAASLTHPLAGVAEPEPLAASHEIVYEPSATALALLRETPRRETNGTVAVLADPVYSTKDDRFPGNNRKASPGGAAPRAQQLGRALRDLGETGAAGGVLRLERLRHSDEEAKGIVSAAGEGTWLEATGFKANRDVALSSELRRYSVVHFAAHGLFDEKHPELSGVVLSLYDERGQPKEGFLSLSDVYNMSLSADLVVLSACQTGLGQNVKGEGLIGLTRGFMHAGAKRVLASLWKVDDEATAELMKRFYLHMLREQMPAPSALRLAKTEVMQARAQWRAPYYWAGFILQGDWK